MPLLRHLPGSCSSEGASWLPAGGSTNPTVLPSFGCTTQDLVHDAQNPAELSAAQPTKLERHEGNGCTSSMCATWYWQVGAAATRQIPYRQQQEAHAKR